MWSGILIFGGAALGILSAAASAQAICSRMDRRKFAQSAGRDGLRWNVISAGTGHPVVVFESGISSSSLSWSLAQPQVARTFTTHSYDRSGLGFSRGFPPCSLQEMAGELRAMLQALSVTTPGIIVAHSFGACIARAYASWFPGAVSGIVLVDPLTPEEWVAPGAQQKRMLRYGVLFGRAGAVLAAFGVVRFCLWLLQRGRRKTPSRVLGLFGSGATATVTRLVSEVGKLPSEASRVVRAHWSRPGSFLVMSAYLARLPALAAEAAACEIPRDIPIVVISSPRQSPECISEHAAIVARADFGEHILAQASGHWIQFDEPELIVRAVQNIAERIRSRAASGPTEAGKNA